MFFLIRLCKIDDFYTNTIFIWVINKKICRLNISMNNIRIVYGKNCINNLPSDRNSMMILDSLAKIMNIILKRLVKPLHVNFIDYPITDSLNKILNQVLFIAYFFYCLYLSFHSLVVLCLSLNILYSSLILQLLENNRFYKDFFWFLANLQVCIFNSKITSLYYFLLLFLILFFEEGIRSSFIQLKNASIFLIIFLNIHLIVSLLLKEYLFNFHIEFLFLKQYSSHYAILWIERKANYC